MASLAAICALFSINSIFQEAANPKGIGNVVLCPWITSEPKIIGIFKRDLFTANSWAFRIFSGPIMPNMPPTLPFIIFLSTLWLTTAPVKIPPPGVTRLSCPIFSSNVIFDIRSFTKASISPDVCCIFFC
ncbi:hypothetical protein D3C72_1135790 [compost metagenome]